MRRVIYCFVIVFLFPIPYIHAQRAHIAPTEPLSPDLQRKAMHLPPGFEIQLVAAEPDIANPINISFDAKGRLWVTLSAEYPYPAPANRKSKDTVKILDDFADNGRARKITTFADALNIPIGVLPDPQAKSAIVYSIPNIFRFRDVNGDSKADQKVLLYDKYGYRDTHGMTGEFMRGFDGWIYACHGFSNTSTVRDKKGNAITMQSGNTYRFKPDGSRIEYFTHGQVNPFGLTFDPLGNLYSCDCHSKPIYQLLKGAYYPSFGKPHDGLGFGPTMIRHSHDSTAIAGIAYYAAEHFPKPFRDNIFIGNVVTNRINRDRLEWHGSTPKAIEMPDLVRSDDPWFRPVDIKLGPDGALYVADFYNRIIGHYEVALDHPGRDRTHGRIWRIVYRGKDGERKLPTRPNLVDESNAGLIEQLGHANLVVRMIAADQMVAGACDVVRLTELTAGGSERQRVHALWVLHRIGKLDDDTLLNAAGDKTVAIRVHALRVLSERTPWSKAIRELALRGLRDDSAHVQRAAAEALASRPSVEQIAPLIALRKSIPPADTHLLHVVRMALRQQLRDLAWTKAKWNAEQTRWIADVCPGSPTRQAADFLLRYAQQAKLPSQKLARYLHHVARYIADPKKISLTRWQQSSQAEQAVLFRAYHRGLQERGVKLGDDGQAWANAICNALLASNDPRMVQTGVELIADVQLKAFVEPLQSLARNQKTAVPVRIATVKALAEIDGAGNVDMLAELLSDVRQPQGLREAVVASLSNRNDKRIRYMLVQTMATAPLAFQRIVAVGLTANRAGGEALLESIAKGKASAQLLRDRVLLARLERLQIERLKTTIGNLTNGLPSIEKKMEGLLASKRTSYLKRRGDGKLGRMVFKKTCAACHQIGDEGKKIGPQLDGIGARGLERILEDLVDPNRHVDQAFRTTILELKNGQFKTGLFLRKAGEILVLADEKGEEQRIAAADVANRTTSPISPMPSNFVEQLSGDDFNHLVSFLLSQRNAKK